MVAASSEGRRCEVSRAQSANDAEEKVKRQRLKRCEVLIHVQFQLNIIRSTTEKRAR